MGEWGGIVGGRWDLPVWGQGMVMFFHCRCWIVGRDYGKERSMVVHFPLFLKGGTRYGKRAREGICRLGSAVAMGLTFRASPCRLLRA